MLGIVAAKNMDHQVIRTEPNENRGVSVHRTTGRDGGSPLMRFTGEQAYFKQFDTVVEHTQTLRARFEALRKKSLALQRASVALCEDKSL
jgi:hypothetical protein